MIVLDPVHQGHGYLLPVRSHQLGVIKDRALRPLDALLLRHAGNHLPCLVTEMAARL